MADLSDLLHNASPAPTSPPPDETQLDQRSRYRRRRHRLQAAAGLGPITVAAAVLAVAVLGPGDDKPDTATGADRSGGTGLGGQGQQPATDNFEPATIWTRPLADEPSAGMQALVTGVVSYDEENGCFLLTRPRGAPRPIIWPPGTEPLQTEIGVVTADGTVIRPGDTIEGGGGEIADYAHLGDEFSIPAACQNNVATLSSHRDLRVIEP